MGSQPVSFPPNIWGAPNAVQPPSKGLLCFQVGSSKQVGRMKEGRGRQAAARPSSGGTRGYRLRNRIRIRRGGSGCLEPTLGAQQGLRGASPASPSLLCPRNRFGSALLACKPPAPLPPPRSLARCRSVQRPSPGASHSDTHTRRPPPPPALACLPACRRNSSSLLGSSSHRQPRGEARGCFPARRSSPGISSAAAAAPGAARPVTAAAAAGTSRGPPKPKPSPEGRKGLLLLVVRWEISDKGRLSPPPPAKKLLGGRQASSPAASLAGRQAGSEPELISRSVCLCVSVCKKEVQEKRGSAQSWDAPSCARARPPACLPASRVRGFLRLSLPPPAPPLPAERWSSGSLSDAAACLLPSRERALALLRQAGPASRHLPNTTTLDNSPPQAPEKRQAKPVTTSTSEERESRRSLPLGIVLRESPFAMPLRLGLLA